MAISKELLARSGGDARGLQHAGKAFLRRIGRSASADRLLAERSAA